MPARPLHRSVPSGRRYSPTLQQKLGSLQPPASTAAACKVFPARRWSRLHHLQQEHIVVCFEHLIIRRTLHAPPAKQWMSQAAHDPLRQQLLCMLPNSHTTSFQPKAGAVQYLSSAGSFTLVSKTYLWWGQAFTQVMHKVQSLLSVSWAGWLCRGQPDVASPSGGSAGPPLRQWYVLQLPAKNNKVHLTVGSSYYRLSINGNMFPLNCTCRFAVMLAATLHARRPGSPTVVRPATTLLQNREMCLPGSMLESQAWLDSRAAPLRSDLILGAPCSFCWRMARAHLLLTRKGSGNSELNLIQFTTTPNLGLAALGPLTQQHHTRTCADAPRGPHLCHGQLGKHAIHAPNGTQEAAPESAFENPASRAAAVCLERAALPVKGAGPCVHAAATGRQAAGLCLTQQLHGDTAGLAPRGSLLARSLTLRAHNNQHAGPAGRVLPCSLTCPSQQASNSFHTCCNQNSAASRQLLTSLTVTSKKVTGALSAAPAPHHCWSCGRALLTC